jgi:hypothetical protein
MVDCEEDEGDVLYGKGWNASKYRYVPLLHLFSLPCLPPLLHLRPSF